MADDLDAEFAELRGRGESVSKRMETAREEAEAANTKQMGQDRSLLAKVIIGTYALVVLAVILYLGWLGYKTIPGVCDAAGDCAASLTAWSTLAEKLLAVVTTAVLPIVTLMLGFYFGTEAAAKAPR